MQPPSPDASAQLPLNSPSESPLVAALKAQINEMHRSEERILRTVHYTLATVGTVVAILAGFSWLNNSRIYERDKQALRDDLIKTVNEMRGPLEQQLNKSLEEHLEKVRSDLTAYQAQRIDQVDFETRAFTLGHIADLRIFLHDVEGTIQAGIDQFNTGFNISPSSGFVTKAIDKLTAAMRIAIQEQHRIPDQLLANVRQVLFKYPDAMSDSRALTLQQSIDLYSSKVHPH